MTEKLPQAGEGAGGTSSLRKGGVSPVCPMSLFEIRILDIFHDLLQRGRYPRPLVITLLKTITCYERETRFEEDN